MLAVVLYVIVAAAAIAAGRNVLLTAVASGRDEGELTGLGGKWNGLRVWRNRSVGILLIGVGLFMGFAGIVSLWRLLTD